MSKKDILKRIEILKKRHSANIALKSEYIFESRLITWGGYFLTVSSGIMLSDLIATNFILYLVIIGAMLLFSVSPSIWKYKENLSISIYKFRLLFFRSNETRVSANNKSKGLASYSLFCAAMLQKPEERDYALGCIEERFKKDFEAHGRRKAKYLFWRDLAMSVYPAISARVMKLLKLAGLSYVIEKFLFK